MLIKAGVDISRLERNTRRALGKVDSVLAKYDEEIVITSTFEGNHGAGSLHYANQAFDIRIPFQYPGAILQGIKDELGFDFDVVLKPDHIHIEYDPKEVK